MVRLTLLVTVILLSGTSLGQFLGSEEERSPTIASDLMVLDASQVAELDRIAVIGNVAVIKKGMSSKYVGALSSAPVLLVVRDPSSGKYGTTDGGIIISFEAEQNLSAIASDHGLNIKHEFSALPMGVLMSSDINAAGSYLSSLRADPRIVTADLDVNYYDNKPN